MAGDVVNFKVFSPLKLRSGSTGKSHVICPTHIVYCYLHKVEAAKMAGYYELERIYFPLSIIPYRAIGGTNTFTNTQSNFAKECRAYRHCF